MLAFLAALIQAVSALIVIAVLVLLLRSTGLQIRAMEARLETVSWALVACFGTWLLYRQLKSALRPAPARSTHAHHHEQDAPCAGCAHVSAPSELQGAWSWRRALALALAVGVRPCTGALLVLVFAIGQGLLWAGIFSTLAMALGTAITVSVLAASAVSFREVAARLAGGGSSKWADRVQLTTGIGGAGLVLVLGLVPRFAWGQQAVLSGPSPGVPIRHAVYAFFNVCFLMQLRTPRVAAAGQSSPQFRKPTRCKLQP